MGVLVLLVAACEPLFFNPSPGISRQSRIAQTVNAPRMLNPVPDSVLGQEYFFTAVSFPNGYDWRRDSLYGGVTASIRLYRNGICVLEVPTGELACADADMHHLLNGHLYTQCRSGGHTVLARDGEEILRVRGEEVLAGLLPGDGKEYTLWQNRNGRGFILRCGADTLLFRSRGTIAGSLREHHNLESGALRLLLGKPAFLYCLDNEWYLASGTSDTRIYPPAGTVLDIRLIDGECCYFYQDNYGQTARMTWRGMTHDLSRSGYRYLNSGSIYEAGGEPFCTAELRQISTSKQYYGVSGKNGGVDLIEGASVVPVSLSVPRIYMGYSPEGRVFYYAQEKGYSWLEGRYYSFAVSPGIWDGETLTLALNPLENGRKPAIWRNGTMEEVDINGFISGVYSVSQ